MKKREGGNKQVKTENLIYPHTQYIIMRKRENTQTEEGKGKERGVNVRIAGEALRQTLEIRAKTERKTGHRTSVAEVVRNAVAEKRKEEK